AGLIGLPDEDVRRRLRSSYKLLEANECISKAQAEVEKLRRVIEGRFLRVIPGFGMAILRSDRELFDAAFIDLNQAVQLFQATVNLQIDQSITTSKDQIAKALGPALAVSPTDEFKNWSKYWAQGTAEDFLQQMLDRCFQAAKAQLENMSAHVI